MTQWQHPLGDALYERARRVIPGGIYGHQNPAFLVEGAFPRFLCESEGCRVRDVDGHEYIDFLCSYGPMVLGYRDPVVEAAADAQRRLCDSGNLPAPNLVDLAEKLVALTPGADWAMFAKNGSDVCTWALAVARRATGRDLVAMVGGTYHVSS
jgi:glutamate-1-semialdehyde 2,1-aminomutase